MKPKDALFEKQIVMQKDMWDQVQKYCKDIQITACNNEKSFIQYLIY